MSDENVDKWTQQGQIHLWKYVENTRNYPGSHLTTDKTFSHSFADLISRMLAAKYDCQKSLVVTAPTREILKVPNNQGGEAQWRAPKLLILKHHKANIPEDCLFLTESEDAVIISAGQQKLELLRECVLKTIQGENDYSIKADGAQLWFW